MSAYTNKVLFLCELYDMIHV